MPHSDPSTAVVLVLFVALSFVVFVGFVLRKRSTNQDSVVGPPSYDVSKTLSVKVEEPSCFAKGIAKSLVEEPEKWIEKDLYISQYSAPELLSIKHIETGFCLTAGNRGNTAGNRGNVTGLAPYDLNCEPFSWIEGSPLPLGKWNFNRAETILLLSTIVAHPIGQYKRKVEQEKEESLHRARIAGHFDKMGCEKGST